MTRAPLPERVCLQVVSFEKEWRELQNTERVTDGLRSCTAPALALGRFPDWDWLAGRAVNGREALESTNRVHLRYIDVFGVINTCGNSIALGHPIRKQVLRMK